MPNLIHGALVVFLGHLLLGHVLPRRLGFVVTETRHANEAEDRAYLPDVAVVLRAGRALSQSDVTRGPLWMPPDLAVEVLSPDDRPGRVAEKVAFYLRAGVPLTWVIDPGERTLDAYRPGEPTEQFRESGIVSAAPVLPEFTFELAELFAILDQE
jgi:Uma2 family endonuclease